MERILDPADNKGAGWALVAAGVLNLLFGIAYLIWTIVGLALYGLQSITIAMDILNNGGGFEAIIAVVPLIAPFFQLFVYLIVPVMAAITIFSGLRFNSFRSKGLVWFGTILVVGVPVLSLVSSLASVCNSGCCCIGNVPTLVLLVIDGGIAGYAAYMLSQPEVQDAFEQAAEG